MGDATLSLYALFCAARGDDRAGRDAYYDRLRHLRAEEMRGRGDSPAAMLFAELRDNEDMTDAQRMTCCRQVEKDVDAAQLALFFTHSPVDDSPINKPS